MKTNLPGVEQGIDPLAQGKHRQSSASWVLARQAVVAGLPLVVAVAASRVAVVVVVLE